MLTLLQGFEKQWGKFVEQMDKVGRSLDTASHAFTELEGTRRRQLERQLDKIDAVRADRASRRRSATARCTHGLALEMAEASECRRGEAFRQVPGYHRPVIFVIAALLLLPIVELVVMIQVGQWLGAWEMLALLVMCTFTRCVDREAAGHRRVAPDPHRPRGRTRPGQRAHRRRPASSRPACCSSSRASSPTSSRCCCCSRRSVRSRATALARRWRVSTTVVTHLRAARRRVRRRLTPDSLVAATTIRRLRRTRP